MSVGKGRWQAFRVSPEFSGIPILMVNDCIFAGMLEGLRSDLHVSCPERAIFRSWRISSGRIGMVRLLANRRPHS